MSKYPISGACPNCGSTEYAKRRPKTLVAFMSDRMCKACKTRYTPPTPVWGGIAFILVGLALAGFGVFAMYSNVVARNGGSPGGLAMAIEGFLAGVGVVAICKGVKALIRPGKA